jgi:hypothetical protein
MPYYDLGDTVTDMWGEVRDSAGALTAVTSAALTVYKPDGATETVAVTNPSVGIYGADYVPAVEGPHRWWLRTTSPATAKTGSFHVNPVIEHSIISVADARQQLNMVSGASDEELRQVISAATVAIEDYMKRAVVRSTRVDYRTVRSGQALCLAWTPVLSLTTVATVDGASTWNVANLSVDPNSGVVSTLTGSSPCGRLQVTYVAGMTLIPANYREATEIVAQHLWDAKRGSKGSPSAGGLDMPGAGITSYGYALPNRAKELLGNPPPMAA